MGLAPWRQLRSCNPSVTLKLVFHELLVGNNLAAGLRGTLTGQKAQLKLKHVGTHFGYGALGR